MFGKLSFTFVWEAKLAVKGSEGEVVVLGALLPTKL